MRVDASATAITWLPFEALDRLKAVPLELALAHYDEPPPEVVPDLDELRRRDAFREANELTAWIEVDGGEIVDYGQTGRSLAGEGPELETRQLAFAAVEFPVIQPEPELGEGWARFTQTAGDLPRPPGLRQRGAAGRLPALVLLARRDPLALRGRGLRLPPARPPRRRR